MNATQPNDLIDANEAARICTVKADTIRHWIHTGKLAAWRVGSRWRVSRADVRALVAPFVPPTGRPRTRAEVAAEEAATDAALRLARIKR